MIVTIDTNVLVNGFSDIISKHFLDHIVYCKRR